MSPAVDTEALDVNSLVSLEDIQAAYEALSLEEEAVVASLDQILANQVNLDQRLSGITSLAPQLETVSADSTQLNQLISFTCGLAERVSCKVRQLDLAKSRVAECQGRVHDLIDLKLCSEGVVSALAEEDYEQAAAHIHRFLAMDESLLVCTPGQGGGGVGLEGSLATLHEAENRVRGVVARRFDEAVKDEDLASIERFFKIFPLLGMHDEGINNFTGYLCTKLAANSKKNLKQALDTPAGSNRANIILADTLTLLFEGIARVVEIHQPLIETYYGPGRLVTVLTRLQAECDTQSGNIFAEVRRRRGIKDKVARLESGTVGAREVEGVLGELCLLQARVEMYMRFVRKRCGQDIEVSEVDPEERKKKMEDVVKMLASSGLTRCAQESLGEYIALEQHFMAENVKLALSLDGMEQDQLTTSMLDDVFFIVKKCINRATGSQNVDCICAVINNACTLLESDFYRVFQDTVKAGLPSTYLDQAYSVIHSATGAKLAGADTDKQRQMFLAYLNNAESGGEYITRLQTTIQTDLFSLQASSTVSPHQSEKIKSCLTGLPCVQAKLKGVLESGLTALRTSTVKPRIKPWLDSFCSSSHNITEEQFSDYSANDPWVQQTIVNLDNLMQSFKAGLTAANFDSLVMIVASEVTVQLEKSVLKSSFSRLGGLQFDREVRSLSSFLTSVTTWTIRDKFSRLQQMAAILNMETLLEMEEFSGTNKLTPVEVRQILHLRTDFKPEEIKRIKLS
eukprot:TRINITY_DN6924_c0_g1_i1.p1 TRINITY_DN6924_c0_g1~~TRINITY_DN6924_c0_g1_i1.p1  ORF type:complete len:751 (-),score=327.81 TRINITY_DN6924_c0_g1_i1:125-2344(-)